MSTPRNPTSSHADDLLLLYRGDVGSVKILMQCLIEFSETTGLHANNLKSNIYLAGVSESVKNELVLVTGFQLGDFPFRHLGIPLSSIKLAISDYSPLLDRLKNKVDSLPKNSISHAGRLELIQSVLHGVKCYWMSILPFPKAVIKKIYSTCRNFLWSSKHHPVAWKLVCSPNECGGLGLRNLKIWNKALLSRILWNIQAKKDSLWIKWVGHYYTDDIWTYAPKTDDSPLLKSLINLRDELNINGDSRDTITARLKEWFEGPKPSTAAAYRWFYQGNIIGHGNRLSTSLV